MVAVYRFLLPNTRACSHKAPPVLLRHRVAGVLTAVGFIIQQSASVAVVHDRDGNARRDLIGRSVIENRLGSLSDSRNWRRGSSAWG